MSGELKTNVVSSVKQATYSGPTADTELLPTCDHGRVWGAPILLSFAKELGMRVNAWYE